MTRDVVHIESVSLVEEEHPVDDGAEGGRVVVNVGRGPQQAVRDGQPGVRAGVAGEEQRPGSRYCVKSSH